MTGHPIEVHWSDEDEAWVADVRSPRLQRPRFHPGEAAAEVELAAEAWIEAEHAIGREVPRLSHRAIRA